MAALIIAAPILFALSAAASAAASAASCAWRAPRLAVSRTDLVGRERRGGGHQPGGEQAARDRVLGQLGGLAARLAQRVGDCVGGLATAFLRAAG